MEAVTEKSHWTREHRQWSLISQRKGVGGEGVFKSKHTHAQTHTLQSYKWRHRAMRDECERKYAFFHGKQVALLPSAITWLFLLIYLLISPKNSLLPFVFILPSNLPFGLYFCPFLLTSRSEWQNSLHSAHLVMSSSTAQHGRMQDPLSRGLTPGWPRWPNAHINHAATRLWGCPLLRFHRDAHLLFPCTASLFLTDTQEC